MAIDEDGLDDELAPRHERAIAALLSHKSIEAAAAACGHSDSTLRAWLKRPSFRAHYRAQADLMLADATSALKAAAQEAVSVLREFLMNGEPREKMWAAKAILEYAYVRTAGRVEEEESEGFDGIDFVEVRSPSQMRQIEAGSDAGSS